MNSKRGKRWLIRGGIALLVLNEIRGLVMAAPALYGAWLAMGDSGALFLALCGLAGVTLSTAVPLVAWRVRSRLSSSQAPL